MDLATNAENVTSTTEAGAYRIPSLPPGQYRVTAAAAGFKNAIIPSVAVAVAAIATADFTVEVGSAAESITVNAEAAGVALSSANAEISRSITAEEYHTWPTVSMDGQRQTEILFYKTLPGTVGDEYQGTINGGQYFSHDILVEGMSVGQGFSTWRTPSSEMISEFSLQSGRLGPEYGSTQTAVANFNVRSGANELHGSVCEAFQNDKLNANSFKANAIGARKPHLRLNNFGVPLGGPLYRPKLYDGRNKTFWYFDPEWFKQHSLDVGNLIQLPVASFKQGDFSQLLNPAFTGDARSGTAVGNGAVFGGIYDPGVEFQSLCFRTELPARGLGSRPWTRLEHTCGRGGNSNSVGLHPLQGKFAPARNCRKRITGTELELDYLVEVSRAWPIENTLRC